MEHFMDRLWRENIENDLKLHRQLVQLKKRFFYDDKKLAMLSEEIESLETTLLEQVPCDLLENLPI